MSNTTLYVDIDGTIAEWRKTAAFEDLFEEGYFFTLRPYKPVLDAIKIIISQRPGITVCTLSAYLDESKYALKEKNQWLDKHLPEVTRDRRYFVPCGQSKPRAVSNGLLNANNFLLDDYSVNLHEWTEAGGTGIKLLNGINATKGTWKGLAVSRNLPAIQIAGQITKMMATTDY